MFNSGIVVMDARMDWAISGTSAILEELDEPTTTTAPTTTTVEL